MQPQSNHTSKTANFLTCLILPYTALQSKHVLTYLCGDIISGVAMPHVQKQSISKFHCGMTGCRSTPTTGCLVLDIRCAERSTHIRPATSNSRTCSRATILICTVAQTLLFRNLILSIPPEKRCSPTIPKCTAAKPTV